MTETSSPQPNRPRGRFDAQAARALSWWRRLQPADGAPGDRATLARLRRASDLLEIAADPETIRLFRMLGLDVSRDRDLERAAVLAGVLAHVKSHRPGSTLARAMAGIGGKPVVSESRMRRFLAAREPEDVLIQFRRTIALLGSSIDVHDVAACVLGWLDTSVAGQRVRTRVAFGYHGALSEAPPEVQDSIEQ